MADLQPASASHRASTRPQAASPADDRSINISQAADRTDLRTMSHTNSLGGLPPEIFDHVAGLTTPKDLMSLRLVSRDVAAKVLCICKPVLFSTKKIMLCHEASMLSALEHAQHPTLGNAIRRIVLFDNVLEDPDESYMSIKPTRGYIRNWEGAHQTQKEMIGRGDVLRLLTDFLKTVSKSGVLSDLRIQRCDGTELISRQPSLPRGCYKNKHPSDDFFLSTLLTAIITSGFAADTFAMIIGTKSNLSTTLLPVVHHGAQASSMSQYELAFSRFKALELVLSVQDTHRSLSDDAEAIKNFCRARFCQKIVSLIITGDCHWDNSFDSVSEETAHQFNELMSIECPRLEVLQLHGYHVECDALMAFAKRHKCLLKAAFGYGTLSDAFGPIEFEDNWDFYQDMASSTEIAEVIHDGQLMG
ncbi:unnamed protein product [Zymoseptoria tritici ST99CH_1A5]|uniref:F-box domain-containing protein n=1 Tax=Zymoseptoria tritici ST99CH_1A5 TaxID=1276529 RepID=A0A1Y6LZM6_ZYMTR|nr:unnamed protein product [Zymoseptoria tritici ST99CH_1A5]